MQGLWSLPVHLIGDSFKGSALLARIIINIIFVPAIGWAWSRQYPRSNTAFDRIIYGTILLLAWYAITIVDLFLHDTRLKVAYGYILVDFFLACLKAASNILILAAAHRIVSGQLFECVQMMQRKQLKAKIWLFMGEFLIITLMIMALYYVGSLLSYEALWLGIADTDTVEEMEGRRNNLQSAFFAIQLVLTFMVFCGACLLSWFRRIDITEGSDPITVGATFALLVRASTELIVETRYHPMPTVTAAVRDTIYGLCSISFLFLLDRAALDLSITSSREPIKAAMEEDTRRYILERVESTVSAGESPPIIRNVIHGIRADPRHALSNDTQDSLSNLPIAERTRLNQLHLAYLDTLMNMYGTLGQNSP